MQVGLRPAAAEVAEQRCRIQQALLLHVQRSLLIAQLGGLGSRHGRVVHCAGLILVEGDLGAAIRVTHGRVQHNRLLRQNPQAGKVVFHILECCQYHATVVGDRGVIGGFRSVHVGTAKAAVEDCFGGTAA